MLTDLFLGYAIGDAYGAGVEFQDRHWIKEHVDFSQLVNARHLIQAEIPDPKIFTENYAPWDYSDDTEMTLGLAKALVSGRPFSTALLIEYWTKEYTMGIDHKGYGRNGHGSMRWVYSGEKNIEEVRQFQATRPYPGNAPPMRAVPIGLVPSNRINEYALINADATHPHPKARAASILVARAAEYHLVLGADPAAIIPYCTSHIHNIDQDTTAHLQAIDQLPPPDLFTASHYQVLCGPQPIVAPRFPVGIYGLPSDALLTGGAALYLLKHFHDAFAGLKFAIQMGGDVDTIAAISTGILGARYGLESIPAYMIEKVEGRSMLLALARNVLANLRILP